MALSCNDCEKFDDGKQEILEGSPLGRTYAGILGPLALAVVSVRGMIHGSDPTTTLWAAWLALLVFAVVGFVIGKLAEGVVFDSVRMKAELELARLENQDSGRTIKDMKIEGPRGGKIDMGIVKKMKTKRTIWFQIKQ